MFLSCGRDNIFSWKSNSTRRMLSPESHKSCRVTQTTKNESEDEKSNLKNKLNVLQAQEKALGRKMEYQHVNGRATRPCVHCRG